NNFLGLASITPSIDKQFLLSNLDCLSKNGQMTNAGVLFFTKSTEFLLLQATVTCVLYKGNEKVHVLDRKDFSGNILENIESAVMFVMRHTNLEYKIEKLRREEISEIPEVALREAIVNAVCHRDYFEKDAHVMVEIFDDRLEISNPGGLPSGLTAQTFGTKSVVRNPIIAALLHRAGYIEKIGTGIKRIEKAVLGHGRGTVSFAFNGFFSVSFSRVQAVQEFPVKELGERLGKTALEIEKATQETAQEIEKTTQETAQEMILGLIKTNPTITRKGLAEKTGLTPDGVKYHLDKLRKQGVIKHVGATKKGHWEVIDDYE
ncbi:MAG: transcriptional regulator, partial [Deltaproteobacteria bacterium CG1_02_45_11]